MAKKLDANGYRKFGILDKLAYAAGDFGCNMSFALKSYLMVFCRYRGVQGFERRTQGRKPGSSGPPRVWGRVREGGSIRPWFPALPDPCRRGGGRPMSRYRSAA